MYNKEKEDIWELASITTLRSLSKSLKIIAEVHKSEYLNLLSEFILKYPIPPMTIEQVHMTIEQVDLSIFRPDSTDTSGKR